MSKEVNLKVKTRELVEKKADFDYKKNHLAYVSKYSVDNEYAQESYAKARDEFHSSTEVLRVALDTVQKRCTARTVTAYDVIGGLEEVTRNLGITKKALNGCEVQMDYWAQDFPRAYDRIPESTHVYAVFKRGEWIITKVTRERCTSRKFFVDLTEEAEREVVRNAIDRARKGL